MMQKGNLPLQSEQTKYDDENIKITSDEWPRYKTLSHRIGSTQIRMCVPQHEWCSSRRCFVSVESCRFVECPKETFRSVWDVGLVAAATAVTKCECETSYGTSNLKR